MYYSNDDIGSNKTTPKNHKENNIELVYGINQIIEEKEDDGSDENDNLEKKENKVIDEIICENINNYIHIKKLFIDIDLNDFDMTVSYIFEIFENKSLNKLNNILYKTNYVELFEYLNKKIKVFENEIIKIISYKKTLKTLYEELKELTCDNEENTELTKKTIFSFNCYLNYLKLYLDFKYRTENRKAEIFKIIDTEIKTTINLLENLLKNSSDSLGACVLNSSLKNSYDKQDENNNDIDLNFVQNKNFIPTNNFYKTTSPNKTNNHVRKENIFKEEYKNYIDEDKSDSNDTKKNRNTICSDDNEEHKKVIKSFLEITKNVNYISYNELSEIINENYGHNKFVYSSTTLDIIAIYLNGQKTLYIESEHLCRMHLNMLMIPAIIISVLVSLFTLSFNHVLINTVVVAALSSFNSLLLALISYLKLDAKAEAHKTSAYHFEELQTKCSMMSGKILHCQDNETQKALTELIDNVENKVIEVKKVNQFIIPEQIRIKFHRIYGDNIFKRVKALYIEEVVLKNKLKNIVNNLIAENNRKCKDLEKIKKLEDEQNDMLEKIIKFRIKYLTLNEMYNDEIYKNFKIKKNQWYGCFGLMNCLTLGLWNHSVTNKRLEQTENDIEIGRKILNSLNIVNKNKGKN